MDNEITEEEVQEAVTEVTSIIQEEEKSGVKVETPDPEELVARAGVSLLSNLKALERMVPQMGKGAIKRALVGGLNLPTGGMPVKLRTDNEKLVFATIQRIIADRFIITQHHISQQMRAKLEAEKEEKKVDIPEEKVDTETVTDSQESKGEANESE